MGKTGYEDCPEHLRKAYRSEDPKDLPAGIIGEWNIYWRSNDPQERKRRLEDPELNAEVLEIHHERMAKFGCSRWQGIMYYKGERGGVYYIGASGNRNYV